MLCGAVGHRLEDQLPQRDIRFRHGMVLPPKNTRGHDPNPEPFGTFITCHHLSRGISNRSWSDLVTEPPRRPEHWTKPHPAAAMRPPRRPSTPRFGLVLGDAGDAQQVVPIAGKQVHQQGSSPGNSGLHSRRQSYEKLPRRCSGTTPRVDPRLLAQPDGAGHWLRSDASPSWTSPTDRALSESACSPS